MIIIDDDNDFNDGDLFMVVNSYMQIGDDSGGRMYEKCRCLCW